MSKATYAGGKINAIKLVEKLGINENIFNFKAIKKLKKKPVITTS